MCYKKRMKKMSLLVKAFVLVFPVLVGCASTKTIPNTTIPDTPVHRDILGKVTAYHQAIQNKDFKTLQGLLHPTYRDDSSAPLEHGRFDMDAKNLAEKIESVFKGLAQLHVSDFVIKPYRIEINDGHAVVFCKYNLTLVENNSKPNLSGDVTNTSGAQLPEQKKQLDELMQLELKWDAASKQWLLTKGI